MGGRLTAEQQEEFLAAYRNTFTAADHGIALKSVYAQFLARFGVDPQTFRRLIRKDVAANPKLYTKLRGQLASRHNGGTQTTEAATPIATSARRPANTKPTKKTARQETCRICGQIVQINPNGSMALHNSKRRNRLVPCPGAGLKVAPPATSSPRPASSKARSKTPRRPADPEKVRKRVKELLGPTARSQKPPTHKPSRGKDLARESKPAAGAGSSKKTTNKTGPTSWKCPNCLKRIDLDKSRTVLVSHHNARGQRCAGSGYQLPQRSTDALDYRVAGSFEGGRR